MRLFLLIAFGFGLAACQGSGNYADAMRQEHDGETPTSSGAVSAADTLGATSERVVYATALAVLVPFEF